MKRLAAWIGLAAVAAIPARADQAADAAAIQPIIADARGLAAPGCAVGVFRDGQESYVVAGSADLRSKRPIDPDTLFYAASISKQFTMLAVAQLVLAGKLSMDDDVRKWLPELNYVDRPITVAMLAYHTAGIPNINVLTAAAGFANVADAKRDDARKVISRERRTRFAPGSRFDYSNGGYFLLSEIVSRASGEKFAAYVDRAILEPMGMTRTVVMDDARIPDPVRALGYTQTGGGFAERDNYPLYGGAGGMMISVREFAKYHYDITTGHKVWAPEIARFMTSPGLYADGLEIVRPGIGARYAAGLQVGADWVYHSGTQLGFGNMFAVLPGKKLAIAMLCNRGEVKPLARMDAIVRAIGGGKLPPISSRLPPPSNDPRYTTPPDPLVD
jgi:CubicO group peptidase (beta-lactamase class C family)